MEDLKRFKVLTGVFCIVFVIWLLSFIPIYQYLCLHPESYQSHVPKKILAVIDSFDKFIDKIRPESMKNSKDSNPEAFFIAGFLTFIPASAFLFFGWTNLVLFPYLKKRIKKRELFI